MSTRSFSQDVLINILTQNSGMVSKSNTVFLEVTVCNTSSTVTVAPYKLKPQLSIPSALVSIPDTGHVLPPGWAIIYNSNGAVWLSNGTDNIPPNGCRTILIAMKGKEAGGPSTITGNMTFSNGKDPGSAPGPATAGDNPADNNSATTIKVFK